MPRIGLRAAIATLVVMAIAGGLAGYLSSSTKDAKAPAATPSTAPTTTPATQPSTTTTTVHPTVELASFVTPSKNIGCEIADHRVRCDIATKTFTPPPQPEDCDLDWGSAVAVPVADVARFVCAGDTVLNRDAPVLAYGTTSKVGGFQCDSAQNGITCQAADTGHGFFLSREQYRFF